jgi:hypothetical protein
VRPAVGRHLVQQHAGCLRVMHIGRGHQQSKDKAKRAGQDVALDPFHLLVAVNPPLPLLGSRYHALGVKEGRRWLRGVAALLTDRAGQHVPDIRPDPVGLKPVVPSPHRLPGAEILRQIAPPQPVFCR